MSDLVLHVHALLSGKAVDFRNKERSAIAKRPVEGAVRIGALGLAGDEQADPVHHGGADKAVHLYPGEHYDYWREFLGDHRLLDAAGAFGENIASTGGCEGDMCLGDRFRLGSTLLEVSHGRAPCWKIDHRFGAKGMTADIVRTGRCGIYFRVIEPGEAQAGDPMALVERSRPDWTIARIFALLIGGRAHEDRAALAHLAQMPVLAEAWRIKAGQLAA